jgi:opacity protein-like surface antigen
VSTTGPPAFAKGTFTANSTEVLAAAWTNPALSASGIDSVTADVNWLGTVRARAGYLVTPNFLVYATGGLAYGGVSASDSRTTNFTYTADSFALAYAQGGPFSDASGVATAGPNPSVVVGASTDILVGHAFVFPSSGFANGIVVATHVPGVIVIGPPTSTGFFTASAPGGRSVNILGQASQPLSVALQSQSLARVSETRVGGTFGGGFEWMMAPNWSFKTEAIYYDLGSVTVASAPLTASINPLTAAIPPTVQGVSTASVVGAINKFAGLGPATVSNAAATHVNFQGVIIRVGLNYHFNLL